jgi:predicted nucleotidyltransferase component of viral defense system
MKRRESGFMITDQEIETRATEFQLRPIDVQKDYVYGWLLKGIFERPSLAAQLVLKGGNALRKGYLPDTRFSKDLDFSSLQGLTREVLETELREVCDFVGTQTGVKFTDEMVVREKELGIPGIDVLEARLYFKSFYGEENLSLKTQLDITQFDRIYLPVQKVRLLHPYSDSAACSTMLSCQKLEEILASKLTTLLHRRSPADLFDLLYAIAFRDQFGVNRREVITTFLHKSIFEKAPQAAREQLIAVPIVDFRELWKSLVAPIASLFEFDFALANFRGLVDSLFALVSAPVSAVAPTGFVAPTVGGRVLGRGGRSVGGSLGGFGFYFPSGIRNSIISAGRSRILIRLMYDGHDRLVEPYKIEYYVRKSDGKGSEYFWGWDLTGGKSGTVGIKQFICDKIQSVRPTSQTFFPKFAVEL